MIAWLVSAARCTAAPSPRPARGLITGASLARLTSGRVVPYTDHLRIYDARGQIAAYTTVLAMTDFPEELETPGSGEWLRTLSEIKAIDDDGDEIDVTVEASVRFRVLTKKTARHLVDETRKSAKEQRRSAAKGTAEETADEIVETERVMREVKRDINRSGLTLVEDHPRLLVSADSREDLEAYVDAVVAHYADRGITVAAGADEQRDLWLESLPGDQIRVPDLGTCPGVDRVLRRPGSGAARRSATPRGPAIGYLTGSTPGLVRFDAAAGSALGDATTTLFLGRSGRGKTTAAMIAGLDSAFAGAWVPLLDLKGDAAGVSAVAADYGVPTAVIEITSKFSGAADLLRVLPVDDALLQVPSQLMLLLPPHLRGAAEAPVMAATRAEIQSPGAVLVGRHPAAVLSGLRDHPDRRLRAARPGRDRPRQYRRRAAERHVVADHRPRSVGRPDARSDAAVAGVGPGVLVADRAGRHGLPARLPGLDGPHHRPARVPRPVQGRHRPRGAPAHQDAGRRRLPGLHRPGRPCARRLAGAGHPGPGQRS